MTVFHLLSDLGLCGVLLCLLHTEPLLLATIAVCALAYGLGQLRFRGSFVLPFLVSGIWIIAAEVWKSPLLLPFLAYTLYFPRRIPDHWKDSRFLQFSAPVAAILLFIGLKTLDEPAAMIVCSLLYFVCGVYYLRQLRCETANLWWRVGDFAMVAAVPMLAALLVTAGRGLVVLKDAFLTILTVLAMPFSALVSLLSAATPEDFQEVANETAVTVETIVEETAPFIPDSTTVSTKTIEIPQFIYLILGIALVAFLLIWLVRFFLQREKGVKKGQATKQWIAKQEILPVESSVSVREDSNRRKVRKVYKRYLTWLTEKGAFIFRYFTSKDILREHPDSAAEQLREIYIRARYSNEEIAPEDVQNVKSLLKIVKNGK